MYVKKLSNGEQVKFTESKLCRLVVARNGIIALQKVAKEMNVSVDTLVLLISELNDYIASYEEQQKQARNNKVEKEYNNIEL